MSEIRCSKCKEFFDVNLCPNCKNTVEGKTISKIESLVNTGNRLLLELITEDDFEKLSMYYDKSNVEDMNISKKTKIMNATKMHRDKLAAIEKES